MEIVKQEPGKLCALHDRAGKFQLFHNGHRIFGHTVASIGPAADGCHYLTIQFPLPMVELGQLPAPPLLAAV